VRELELRELDSNGYLIPYDRGSPYCDIYLALRQAMKDHIRVGIESRLALIAYPTGASLWRPDPVIVRVYEKAGNDP
jgi:hypothetical protein